MATQANFAATPHVASIVNNTTADTSTTAPTNVAILFTAGASGSRIDTIRITQVATTNTGAILNLFLYDGTTYHLFDTYSIPTQTVSSTATVQPVDIYYQNLVIQTGWSIRFTITVAQTATTFLNLVAFGGDF